MTKTSHISDFTSGNITKQLVVFDFAGVANKFSSIANLVSTAIFDGIIMCIALDKQFEELFYFA